MSDNESGPWLGLKSHHPQCLFFIHDDPCPCDCHVARIAELEAELERTRLAWVNGDDAMCEDVCAVACKGPCQGLRIEADE